MVLVRPLSQGPTREPSALSSRVHPVAPLVTAMALAPVLFTRRAPFVWALTAMVMIASTPVGVMGKERVLHPQIAGRVHPTHAQGALASQTAMVMRTAHQDTAVKPQTLFALI